MSVRETTNRLSRTVANISNRYAPAFITVILLAGAFYYYSSVVVKGNERHLKERKFRGLHQVAANIKNKLETYEQKNALNFIQSITKPKTAVDTTALEKEFGLEFHPLNERDTADNQNFKYDSLKKRFEFFPGDSGFASVELRVFLQPLLRRDIFNQYMLADNGSIIFDELNISHKSLKEFISTTIQHDTIEEITITESGNLVKKNIGGKDYWLFSIAFASGGKNKFTIGGYLTDDQYQAERKYIPPYGILCMVIGVILVIVLIPLLKIFLMHRSEQLVTMTASASFAAVHLLGSTLVLSILTLYVNFHIIRNENDENLQTLARDIDRTLKDEIQADMNTLWLASADLVMNDRVKSGKLREIEDAELRANGGGAHEDSTWRIPRSAMTSPDKIRTISTRITDSLTLDTLFDVLIRKNKTVKVFRNGTSVTLNEKLNSSDSIRNLLTHVYWTDSNGQQQIRWTKLKVVPQRINVNDRDYFKAVAENKMFYTASNKPYHFTDISSWISNSNFAVISIPVSIKVKDTASIIMVSGGTRLRSLFNPILPAGYSFCIVDETGKVLFHKESIRNLNENLLQECTNTDVIQPILTLRKTDFFETRYAGSDYRFFCQPIQGTSYSLLTFRDLQQSWAKDLDIVSATSILVLLNLGVMLMTILAIKALSYTKGKTKIHNLALTWLRPSGGLRREYISITCFFAITMFTQLGLVYLLSKVDNLALMASTFIYTFLMLIATFHQFSLHRDPHNKVYLRPQKILIGLFSFLALCIAIHWIRFGDTALWLVAETLLYVFIYFILTYRWHRITPMARKVMEHTKTTWLKPGFRHSYTWFVWSLIISTSVIPLLIFYMLCHDEQNKMSARYAQWDFANQLSNVPTRIFDSLKGKLETSYRYPFHNQIVANEVSRYSEISDSAISTDGFAGFYRAIKPSFLNYNLNLELLNDENHGAPEYSWRQTIGSESGALYFQQESLATKDSTFMGWKLSEATKNQPTNHFTGFLKPPNLLLIVVLVASLYFVLRLLIRKIFFDGAMEPSYAIGLDILTNFTAGVQGNLFIYGPPGIQKINAVKKEILKQGSFVHIDLSDLADMNAESLIAVTESELKKVGKTGTILLITNINIHSDDPVITEKKLSVIEHFHKLKRRIFIISSKYFESLGMFKYNSGQQAELNYTARWENLMKSFYTVYHRWQRKQPDRLLHKYESKFGEFIMKSYNIMARPGVPGNGESDDIYMPLSDGIQNHINGEIQKLINKIIIECSHSAFLYELTEPIIAYASKLASPTMRNIQRGASWPANRIISRHFIFVFDKVCERIESLAQNHYLSVWNAVTIEEQRTLYDIAIDELVNPLNRKTAARLCEIGLVTPIEGIACYKIMNVSFRRYIIYHVSNNEISIFKKEIAAKGFGSSIQLPLVIVAIAAFGFIVFTQKEAFTSFISYIGAAFAGITGLVKIISSIPSAKGEGKA